MNWYDAAKKYNAIEKTETVKKFAIRHRTQWGGFIGYLAQNGHNSPASLRENTLYNSVDEAVRTIIIFVQNFIELAKFESFSIIGVEIEMIQSVPVSPTVRLVREIPLKTL